MFSSILGILWLPVSLIYIDVLSIQRELKDRGHPLENLYFWDAKNSHFIQEYCLVCIDATVIPTLLVIVVE